MQIRDLIPWGDKGTDLARREDDNPVLALQRDVNRIFENFWKRFDQPFGTLDRGWGMTGPHADVAETEDKVEVSVELPGLEEKDVDVAVTDDVLTIKGEKRAEREENKKGYYLSERSYGSFYRSIPLPPGVDTDKANAEFKKGVLTVTLPKTPEAQARVKKIEVKAS
ncbi:Hsp20/alpha crystallin family protein [Rhodospirillaceae bacterium SYSU D60014]|uniref:Hsp20/alpha crystallin family protein n=1 Tax=Virgifigura deserti TaxID=2268457 RepID=UPI000E674881